VPITGGNRKRVEKKKRGHGQEQRKGLPGEVTIEGARGGGVKSAGFSLFCSQKRASLDNFQKPARDKTEAPLEGARRRGSAYPRL